MHPVTLILSTQELVIYPLFNPGSRGGGSRPQTCSAGHGDLREALLLLQGVLRPLPLHGAQRHRHRGAGDLFHRGSALPLGRSQCGELAPCQRRLLRPSVPQDSIPQQRVLPGMLGRSGSAWGAGGRFFLWSVFIWKTSAYEFLRVLSPFFTAFILQSQSWAGKAETQNKVTIVFFRTSIQETDFDYTSSSASTVIFQSLSLVSLLLLWSFNKQFDNKQCQRMADHCNHLVQNSERYHFYRDIIYNKWV